MRARPDLAGHRRVAELLPVISGRKPARAPEGRVSYGNTNYLLLAAAIEAADGRSYYEFVEAEILRPLGLEATTFGTVAERPKGAAVGWIKDEVTDPLGVGDYQSHDARFNSRRGSPAGGAWSTARDMWTFVDAVAAGKVVKPETLQTMWGDRRRVGRNMGAALGFMSRGTGEQPAFLGHSGGGGNMGVSTSVYVTPDREWAVIVLSNFSSPAGEMLGGQVMDYLATLP
jgi:CubicO group peptidase (beta-lactamase class C family)